MDSENQKKTTDNSKTNENEDYGFYFFPHRKKGEGRVKQDSFYDHVLKGFHSSDNARCVVNARACAEKS